MIAYDIVRRCVIKSKNIRKQGQLFAKQFALPNDLLDDERTHIALVLLINPNSVIAKKAVKPNCVELVRAYDRASSFVNCFYKIFNESNKSLRQEFFSQRVIQYLWNIFRL